MKYVYGIFKKTVTCPNLKLKCSNEEYKQKIRSFVVI